MFSKHKSVAVQSSEITPEHMYFSRRQFLKALGVLGAGAFLAACNPVAPEPSTVSNATDAPPDIPNTYEEIVNFNNYYEFTPDKLGVAKLAKDFPTNPWQVEVYGLVNKPKTFGMEDILARFTQEERIYRLRCVEGWSMVVPWIGFPLADLLKEVEPLSGARYVRFESLLDAAQMPEQKSSFYPWPYQEGLRLDEAMNDLTILATGLYGKPMPNQNGAPIRLVVPWKYGFKSLKAIVKIELVDYQPETFWSKIAPNEYGFYSNVNPEVSHPRWSQSSERRIGEISRRPTLMFNGYAEQVAHLYRGLDLTRNF